MSQPVVPPTSAPPAPAGTRKRPVVRIVVWLVLGLVAGTGLGGWLGGGKDEPGTGMTKVDEQTAWGRWAYIGGAVAMAAVGAGFGWVGKTRQATEVKVRNAALWGAAGAATGLILSVVVVS